MEFIPLIYCTELPRAVKKYLEDEYDCSCHCDHDILPIEDNRNVFAEWLKAQGYKFKSNPNEHPNFDLIVLYGS
jgi:hypothetical protein